MRNVFPGSEINSLAKPVGINVVIYEEDESIYNLKEKSEEEKLFEVNESVRSLLEGLDNKENVSLEHKE